MIKGKRHQALFIFYHHFINPLFFLVFKGFVAQRFEMQSAPN
jgi:hypothetical protein